MSNPQIRFVDSHCHLDIAGIFHPQCIDWLKAKGCMPVSWSFGLEIGNVSDLVHYLETQQKTIHELNEQGLCCRYLCGVHPRNIPEDLDPSMIRSMILPFLDDPLCLGIGEIGLESGNEREKEILIAQLELEKEIADRKKVFGIHTPRKNKVEVTKILLGVLDGSASYADSIVIDHCTKETIAGVLERGYHAGITLSPEKTDIEEVDIMVRPGYESRIMLNTDSGTRFHDDLYRYVDKAGEEKKGFFKDNALIFYNLSQITPN